MWTFANPVQIEFGPGTLSRTAARIAGRPWALVTYDLPSFREAAAGIAAAAGNPVVAVTNIMANPDFADLTDSCDIYVQAERQAQVIVALGGGSIIDAAKVLAASDGRFEDVRRHLTGNRRSTRSASSLSSPFLRRRAPAAR